MSRRIALAFDLTRDIGFGILVVVLMPIAAFWVNVVEPLLVKAGVLEDDSSSA